MEMINEETDLFDEARLQQILIQIKWNITKFVNI